MTTRRLCRRSALMLVAMPLIVGGCSKSKSSLILGTWKPEVGMAVMQLTFNADGTCTFFGQNGKYRLDGDNLIITEANPVAGKTDDVTLKITTLDDKKLTLSMPEQGEQTFIRVE